MRVRSLLDKALQGVCVLLMLGLAVMVLAAVLLRTIGKSPLWYDEVAAIWLVWLTFFAATLVTLRRAHLGFDGAIKIMAPPLRRMLFVVAEAASLIFYAAAAVYGWRVLDIIAGETLISLPWLGYEVVQGVIPVTAALMFISQLLSAPDAWRRLNE
ncbi:MAG: TRAP transporter small permease subunit [Gammaproteobacteria bacterium]|nr:TRAP transporter small permease subunit [Gammaproteobacteria bacterium]MDD9799460.1 TRAP transporter small permease subunit [Gammaproteobacteria bacterium]MDD9816375.1 TRAP transporter small permease subunit [Gammaproteobacteria bacterium]MDD9850377.1 TRAP transporter small permease subunit [Gammaproteobacteria bacterium]MDD9870133.1 TRAP transporter small permease subunit [Gammaproteobacteria bacterium]